MCASIHRIVMLTSILEWSGVPITKAAIFLIFMIETDNHILWRLDGINDKWMIHHETHPLKSFFVMGCLLLELYREQNNKPTEHESCSLFRRCSGFRFCVTLLFSYIELFIHHLIPYNENPKGQMPLPEPSRQRQKSSYWWWFLYAFRSAAIAS